MSAVLDWDRGRSLRLFHRHEVWNMGNALVGVGWTDGGDDSPSTEGDAARGRGASKTAEEVGFGTVGRIGQAEVARRFLHPQGDLEQPKPQHANSVRARSRTAGMGSRTDSISQ
jgi:hypothetical protein